MHRFQLFPSEADKMAGYVHNEEGHMTNGDNWLTSPPGTAGFLIGDASDMASLDRVYISVTLSDRLAWTGFVYW